ncbi:TRAP transporter small permease [Celeribacter sp. SCSIO 80788]|uniref:TRAP transporter small permease n=1 Tax=Celeribacter sp. SCSIO 80788 TaxID=3117013 RepID=UPI003DA48596
MSKTYKTRLGMMLDHAELYVASVFFILMLAVVVFNVFLRFLFGQSILFTEEIAYLGFTWSTFAAVAWLYRTKALISVDIFFLLLPASLRRVLSVLMDITLILANLWFCRLAWVLASGGFLRKTPVLEIPYFWVNLAPLLAFGLMACYSVAHLIHGFTHPYVHDDEHDAEMYQDSSL